MHHLLTSTSILFTLACAAGCAAGTGAAPSVGNSHQSPSEARAVEAPVRAERIAVAFADAKRLASMLDTALVEGPAHGAVRAVLVDDRSGELLVFGTDAGIARVRAFLSPGLIEDAGADDVEVVKLEHADAQNLVRIVTPMVHGRIRVEPDPAMNALVLSGEPSARDRVKKIVASLDAEAAKAARAP